MSQLESKSLRKIIGENTERGFIWKSKLPAGALVTFTKKKNRKLCMYIDYRQLNAITMKNCYPLPLITELLDRTRGACYFTKLDLQSAYNLVCIKEEDKWKMVFHLQFGHFEWLVMSLGLTNAPVAF